MPSFEDMQNIYANVGTHGQQIKSMSDMFMQQTFDTDIGTKQCYIYDYYHDDQFNEGLSEYNPALSKTKIPVKLKFIVKTYKTVSKDDPEYHIMFEPDVWNSMSCKPDWFVDGYEKFGVRFPVGLYVDIPDDRGIYQKWLIVYDEVANQFPKFGILKCNYKFQWIEDNGTNRYKRNMWGVEKTQSSYTSGEWTGDKVTVFDEQGKFWLPWNLISSFLHHDMRLFISMIQKTPYVYKVSKIKNTSPKGIISITVVQTEFNQHVDYVNLDTGDMYANYYSSNVEPEENISVTDNIIADKLLISTDSYNLKIGVNTDLSIKSYDKSGKEVQVDNDKISWKLLLNNVDVTQNRNIITYFNNNNNRLTINFVQDARFVGKILNIECSYNDLVAKAQLNITH